MVVFTPYVPGWQAPGAMMRQEVLRLRPFQGWVFIHHDRQIGHFSAIMPEAVIAGSKRKRPKGRGDVSRANAIEVYDSD